MTSAQNHRQPSNGNKWILFFGIALLVSSCGLFGKGEYYEPDNPGDTVEKPEDPGRVDDLDPDTLRWTTKPNDYPPIGDPVATVPDPDPDPIPDDPVVTPTDPHDSGGSTYNKYNVAIIAPFKANNNPTKVSDKYTLRSAQFYGGSLLALDKLYTEGMSISVAIYDTERNATKTREILSRPEFDNIHLILGPMSTEPLKVATEHVKKRETVLISPWNPKSGITYDNPRYIQVSPFVETRCQAIMRHARKYHKSQNITLIGRSTSGEKERFRFFQDENRMIRTNGGSGTLKTHIVNPGDNFADVDLKPYFSTTGDTSVFIIPSINEKFVSAIMRKIVLDGQNKPVVIYGFSNWMDFERVGYEYYENLNVHLASPYFIDGSRQDIRDFKRSYYNRFGTVPDFNAYLGYDTMLFFGRQLKKYGTNFPKKLQEEDDRYLHTTFSFRPDFMGGDERKASQYENKHLNILKFDNFKFYPVN